MQKMRQKQIHNSNSNPLPFHAHSPLSFQPNLRRKHENKKKTPLQRPKLRLRSSLR